MYTNVMTFVGDFETRCSWVDKAQGVSSVWLWDLCELKSLNHVTGRTIEEFFDTMERCAPCMVYFHNLKFDGQFILSQLFRMGFVWVQKGSQMKARTFTTLITELGVFYNIRIQFDDAVVEIRDSEKKIPGTVRRIAEDFHLPISKGECDYAKERSEDYIPTIEEIGYVQRDTEIIARVLVMEYDKKMDKMTSASDTMSLYKASIPQEFRRRFPIVKKEVDDYIRQAYRGGVCFVNPKYQGKVLTTDVVYDVNSMYPYQMCIKQLPYGQPVKFEGKYERDLLYPLYIQRIRVSFELKDGCMPSILDNRLSNVLTSEQHYLATTSGHMIELTLTNIDLDLMFKHYDVYEIEYIDGYKFKGSHDLFEDYVMPLYRQKCKSQGAEKQLIKILINSLYGKFASQTHHYNKVPYIDKIGIVRFDKDDNENTSAPIYTAISVFVTAYARAQLFRVIDNNIDIFIYCDTDSVHLCGVGQGLYVHDKDLGAWKIETADNPVKRCKYLGAKCYIQELDHADKEHPRALNIKVAGATDEVKEQITFDNFEEGSCFSGKLKPRSVVGGVILEEEPFSIKEHLPVFRRDANGNLVGELFDDMFE